MPRRPYAAARGRRPRVATRRPRWRETVLLVVGALLLAIAVKALLVQAFYIPSGSMEPGLVRNDRILVQKPSYWFGGSPRRGDVVVFADPGGWLDAAESPPPAGPVGRVLTTLGLAPSGGHLVKRVIGVAGDTIVCCDDRGRLSVNGVPLDEDAFIRPQDSCDGPMIVSCDWTAGPVPAGRLFVMGDHRDDSADSSAHLCVPDNPGCLPGGPFVATDLVVGKVLALVWPADRVTLLHRPAVFATVPDPS